MNIATMFHLLNYLSFVITPKTGIVESALPGHRDASCFKSPGFELRGYWLVCLLVSSAATGTIPQFFVGSFRPDHDLQSLSCKNYINMKGNIEKK